jgi:hypothetical protein
MLRWVREVLMREETPHVIGVCCLVVVIVIALTWA